MTFAFDLMHQPQATCSKSFPIDSFIRLLGYYYIIIFVIIIFIIKVLSQFILYLQIFVRLT